MHSTGRSSDAIHHRMGLCALLLLAGHMLMAQRSLPILRSNSSLISIREGHSLYPNCWTVSSRTRPDVFATNPFEQEQRITFYSDIDSLSFKVVPNRTYDFVVLLHGTDSAFTRINTFPNERPSLAPKLAYTRAGRGAEQEHDTIPFTQGTDDYIHLKGTVNGSDTLDFIFDTGAGACVLSTAVTGKGVHLKLDGSQQNSGSDGNAIVPTSSNNTLRIAGLEWDHVPLLLIDYSGLSFDAVLGWNAFDGKVVEIDRSNSRLIIHRSMPPVTPDHFKLELRIINGIPYMPCTLVVNGKESVGWFDFDTGSDGTLMIGHAFATENGLDHTLPSLGTSMMRGSTGVSSALDVVTLPELRIGVSKLLKVPLAINEKDPEGVANNQIIGTKILRRFHIILDADNGSLYLRPNRFLNDAW